MASERHTETEPARQGRVYRLRDAAWLLVFFGLTLLLFDADGLHSWATRMDVGPVQDFWLSIVEPWRDTAAQARLTEPRRLALDGAERLGSALGGEGGTEELLARGWNVAGSPSTRQGGAAPAAPAGPAAPGDPARSDAAQPPAGDAAGQTRVLLVGDSLMVTLSSTVQRSLAGRPEVRVIAAHRSATGLSRPDVYDWPAVVASFLSVNHPQLAVCSFGGNDAQDVRQDGKVVAYGTQAWDDLYTARVHALMASLTASGAEVLWLGLPPMRPTRFDARMRHLNELYEAEAARTPGVTYLETASAVGDGHGRFSAFLRGPRGKLVRVRHDDGIHFAEYGAELVSAKIQAWVAEHLPPETATASPPPARPAAAAP